MDYVFLVCGYIDDGLGGEYITFGIFNDQLLADQCVLKFIQEQNCQYTFSDEVYSVTYNNDYHFTMGVRKYPMNKIVMPYFVGSSVKP